MDIDRVEVLFFISPNFVKKLTIQVKKKESTYPFQPSCNCFFRIQSIFYLKVNSLTVVQSVRTGKQFN